MKRHISALLGSAAAVVCIGAAQAAPAGPSAIQSPQSYAELLEPVPNATAVITADDVSRVNQPKRLFQLAQFHHHLHHHHHSAFFPGAVIGGILGGLAAGPAYYDYDYVAPPVVVQRT